MCTQSLKTENTPNAWNTTPWKVRVHPIWHATSSVLEKCLSPSTMKRVFRVRLSLTVRWRLFGKWWLLRGLWRTRLYQCTYSTLPKCVHARGVSKYFPMSLDVLFGKCWWKTECIRRERIRKYAVSFLAFRKQDSSDELIISKNERLLWWIDDSWVYQNDAMWRICRWRH